MKIAVNTRLLLKDKLEGIGWVAYECLRRMVKNHPEVEFYFIFDREYDEKFVFADNVEPVVLFPPARHPFLYIAYFEFAVTRYLRKLKPDLYLSTDAYLCLRSNTKQLAVFHDINFEHFPQDFPKIHLWHYKKFFHRYAKKAARILTVSEFSKNDICEKYGISPEKIDVAYNGANEIFTPLDEDVKTKVRNQYSGGNPYFMFVGSLHPRKNLARLFTAFDMFKKRNNNDIKLIIVGNKKWWTEPIKNAYDAMKHKDDVIFAGRLSAEDLHYVTASALASVYVSYFEGFGIPIVEAFKCDTPVITSNVTSMPEVAGDAAILVNPFDESDIADAMEKVLDEGLRNELIEKGRAVRNRFSWDKTAEIWWKCIEKLTIDK